MPLQIRTSASGVGQRRSGRPGGSGMKGSCEGAKPLLSQCLENVWLLELSARKGCLRASCRICAENYLVSCLMCYGGQPPGGDVLAVALAQC